VILKLERIGKMKLKLIRLISKNHYRTNRNYFKRMADQKIKSMGISKKYAFDYWDGSRRFGYGGYKYDGRWKTVAKKLIKKYKLNKNSKILDIGCGKGHLIFELSKILNSKNVYGIDLSKYAKKNSPSLIRNKISCLDARKKMKYKKNYFDLVISINLIHNFSINEIFLFIKNILDISKKTYLATESYRNDKELFNLQCWALTCETFLSPKEWIWIFKEFKYNGDYELIFFE
jgi:cyclopropane fatty-acyl-phospholipid synthase-like methyltransferase